MPKPTLTCTTPYGTFTRQTLAHYTHVLVIITPEAGRALSWHGSYQLAGSARRTAQQQLDIMRRPDNRTWYAGFSRAEVQLGRLEIYPVDSRETGPA